MCHFNVVWFKSTGENFARASEVRVTHAAGGMSFLRCRWVTQFPVDIVDESSWICVFRRFRLLPTSFLSALFVKHGLMAPRNSAETTKYL